MVACYTNETMETTDICEACKNSFTIRDPPDELGMSDLCDSCLSDVHAVVASLSTIRDLTLELCEGTLALLKACQDDSTDGDKNHIESQACDEQNECGECERCSGFDEWYYTGLNSPYDDETDSFDLNEYFGVPPNISESEQEALLEAAMGSS
jgi:hypothetical protein